jgi:hypothetical protein
MKLWFVKIVIYLGIGIVLFILFARSLALDLIAYLNDYLSFIALGYIVLLFIALMLERHVNKLTYEK